MPKLATRNSIRKKRLELAHGPPIDRPALIDRRTFPPCSWNCTDRDGPKREYSYTFFHCNRSRERPAVFRSQAQRRPSCRLVLQSYTRIALVMRCDSTGTFRSLPLTHRSASVRRPGVLLCRRPCVASSFPPYALLSGPSLRRTRVVQLGEEAHQHRRLSS